MVEIKEQINVLFVCMGNICRSPTAEGVFRHHVNESGFGDRILVDSAGTHAYHVGDPPDRRAHAAAERRGISLGEIRARRVTDDDFERFDYIIAMDEDNQLRLLEQAPDEHRSKVQLSAANADLETQLMCSHLPLIILVLVAFSWPGLTILIRSMVLQIRSGQLVEATVALGASKRRIMLRHIFPHTAPFVFAQTRMR